MANNTIRMFIDNTRTWYESVTSRARELVEEFTFEEDEITKVDQCVYSLMEDWFDEMLDIIKDNIYDEFVLTMWDIAMQELDIYDLAVDYIDDAVGDLGYDI